MLSININQDVEQYEEAVAAGLNAKQTIAAVLSMLAVAAAACILYFYIGLPLNVAVYIAIPISIPIMLPAMGKQYGLTVAERFRGSNKRKRVVAFATARTLRITEKPQETEDKGTVEKRKFRFKMIGRKKKEQRINEKGELEQSKGEAKEENSQTGQIS